MKPFKLYYPVKPWINFQKFGVCHPVVCHIYKKQLGLDGHNGIDAVAKHGQIVRASHDGIVTFAGEDGSAGYGVVVRTLDKHEYNEPKVGEAYYKSIYWHLLSDGIKVRAGQKVKTGDVIGLADSTGISTGDHLHFGVKPMYKGEKDWEWWNAEQNNGFKGAIDPEPFFTGTHAEDIYKKPKPSVQFDEAADKAEAEGNAGSAKLFRALAFVMRLQGR